MKESYRKGLANHPGPESCVVGRKADHEALTGVQAGWVSSREIDLFFREPTPSGKAEGNSGGRHYCETPSPCVVGDPRHAWKHYAREPGDPSSARSVRSGGPEGERDER